jgi:hypothetical protein
MTDRAEHRASQVKTNVAEIAELIVDVIAEYIQKEHVAENMPETAVQKSVCYELPQKRMRWRENKLLRPWSQNIPRLSVGPVSQQKYDYIYGYEGIIGIGRSGWPDACTNWQQHNRTSLPLKKQDDSKSGIVMAFRLAGKT